MPSDAPARQHHVDAVGVRGSLAGSEQPGWSGPNRPSNVTSADSKSADGSPADACPSPLPWQQVLTNVRNQAESWTLGRNAVTISGRTIGEGPPLYFLNGLGGNHELFALLAWLLRDEFRCILFDYPDLLGSRHIAAGSIGEELANMLFTVADMHGDRRFSICASSFGSLTALSAMYQRPGRVERAVLQAGFAHRQLSRFERVLVAAGRRLSGKLSDVPLREQIQRQSHRPWFPLFDESRFRFFVENTGAIAISALAHRAAIVDHIDLRPQLAEIRQPVLLVDCEGDGRVASACRQELASGLAHSCVERLPGCGQLPHLTHPHQLAKLVRSFLSDDVAAAKSTGVPQQQL